MSLPEGSATTSEKTEKWQVHAIGVVRDDDGTGVDVHVIDRHYVDGEFDGETRRRVLSEEESTNLWSSTATKTFANWAILIHQNAE